MKKLIRRLRTRLRRLLGKNARTVWISHPVFAQHHPGVGHPDSPERTAVIEAELKRQDIWRHLQTVEAEEISDARLALVHPRKYLRSLEACLPQPDKIYRLDGDTVMSHSPLWVILPRHRYGLRRILLKARACSRLPVRK